MAYKEVVMVAYKSWLSRHRLIPSFCKRCGCDVQDFIAPNQVWRKIAPHLTKGNVACYNCFSKLCRELGLTLVWELRDPTQKEVV